MTNRWVCANCGYASRVRFRNDICPRCRMTDWHCVRCGFTLTAPTAPILCEQCGSKESYINVTGYIPDWPLTEEVELTQSTVS